MSLAGRFPDLERRCGRSAPNTAWRIGASLLRRRSPTLSVVVVEIGGARMRADLRTPLGLSLYRYGFCPPEARLLSRLLRPGDVFVDGGANVGLFSLIAAVAVGPSGRVIACEPGPETMAELRANAKENRFAGTLDLHEVALSDRTGSARFTVFDMISSGLASFAPEASGGRQVDVVLTTLDALTANLERRVAVVKLDIEGAEAKALQGAGDLVTRDAPVFIIELEPEHLARQGSSIADVRATLEPHGYEPYAITPAARLVRSTGGWGPSDESQPNVVLALPSQSVGLAAALEGR